MNRAIGLEKHAGEDVGRDPRQMSRDELALLGHEPMSPLKALRLRCLDCRDGEVAVRKCADVECPSWPYRMGTNAWRKERSEAQQSHTLSLAGKRRAQLENQPSGRRQDTNPGAAGVTLPGDDGRGADTAPAGHSETEAA